MGLKEFYLARIDRLDQASAFRLRKDYDEARKRVRDAVTCATKARAKLGVAASEYDGLRQEFVDCRLLGHLYSDRPTHVGRSVHGGYGETFRATCDRCGTVRYTWKVRRGNSFVSNSSAKYEYPDGYKLVCPNEVLRRSDVWAMEFMAMLDTELKQLESTFGLDPLEMNDRHLYLVA